MTWSISSISIGTSKDLIHIYIYQRYVKGMFFRYRDVLDGISDLHQRYPKGILEARTLPIKLYLYKGILKVY